MRLLPFLQSINTSLSLGLHQCNAKGLMRNVAVNHMIRKINFSTSDNLRIQGCLLAIFDQQKQLIATVDDEIYTFNSPLLQASIGQHLRHAIDHLRLPIEASTVKTNTKDILLQYDIRARDTPIEYDRKKAIIQIQMLETIVSQLESSRTINPIAVAFMLAADGKEVTFQSTLNREFGFAVHHCIHHHAMIKVLLQIHYPDIAISLPKDFGIAPSTANYIYGQGQTSG